MHHDEVDEMLDAFYQAKELMKPQTWACQSCRSIFVVAGMREPQACPACGSEAVEPDLTGA